MQIFPCPFCGPRDESEFHYIGEPKARPEPASSVSDAAWAEYLWFNSNAKGLAREIWLVPVAEHCARAPHRDLAYLAARLFAHILADDAYVDAKDGTARGT